MVHVEENLRRNFPDLTHIYMLETGKEWTFISVFQIN